jgi:hypothetical protein
VHEDLDGDPLDPLVQVVAHLDVVASGRQPERRVFPALELLVEHGDQLAVAAQQRALSLEVIRRIGHTHLRETGRGPIEAVPRDERREAVGLELAVGACDRVLDDAVHREGDGRVRQGAPLCRGPARPG